LKEFIGSYGKLWEVMGIYGKLWGVIGSYDAVANSSLFTLHSSLKETHNFLLLLITPHYYYSSEACET
jgi:hypothetical protein